jgi:hypothetical protein
MPPSCGRAPNERPIRARPAIMAGRSWKGRSHTRRTRRVFGSWLRASHPGLVGRVRIRLSALKMSYFTGPNEIHLIPLRLFTATHSSALTDDDIQRLVQREVRMILTRWPEMKAALPAAYDNADPEGQALPRTRRHRGRSLVSRDVTRRRNSIRQQSLTARLGVRLQAPAA